MGIGFGVEGVENACSGRVLWFLLTLDPGFSFGVYLGSSIDLDYAGTNLTPSPSSLLPLVQL